MGQLKTERSTTDTVSIRVNYLMFINGNMSQRALGFRIGMKPATLGGKITGIARWNLDEIVLLSELFEVTTDYLLGRQPIESAGPIIDAVSDGSESVIRSVAGAGFEPATSRL